MINMVKLPTNKSSLFLRVAKGHFATSHSHINYYIDVTTQKSRLSEAKAVAKELVAAYQHSTIVDTVLCLDGTQVIGTCLANELTKDGFANMNAHQTIYVITPEYTTGSQIILRDNLAPMVKGKHVLILAASITTGYTAQAAIEAVNYYGGMVADQAYPLLVMKVLPKPLMGFFAAVMFGAILSSFNSVLNSASTIFTLNVWQPIWGKQASNNKVVKVGQIFGTVVGVVSIAIAPFVMFFGTGIMNFINECWGFFSMPLLTAVLFGLLSKKAPAIAPKIVIPVHIVLYGLTKVIPFFSRFHYLYVVFALFVLECIIYAICIKVSPRQLAWEMPDAKVMDMTPWKSGKVWAIAGAAVVAIMYLIFSPLGIGA